MLNKEDEDMSFNAIEEGTRKTIRQYIRRNPTQTFDDMGILQEHIVFLDELNEASYKELSARVAILENSNARRVEVDTMLLAFFNGDEKVGLPSISKKLSTIESIFNERVEQIEREFKYTRYTLAVIVILNIILFISLVL